MKGYTSEKIEGLLTQLRENIKDIMETNPRFDNNFYLYRWLIHYHMKIERVERAIRESIEWRKVNNADALAEEDWASECPELAKEIVIHTSGLTKNRQPVMTMHAGGIDFRQASRKYGKENLRRMFLQWHVKLEKLMLDHYMDGTGPNVDILESQISGNNNNEIEKFNNKNLYNPCWFHAAPVQIVSYHNFSMWNATYLDGLGLFVECAKVGFNYFPCSVSAVYCVNLNKFSKMFVNMMKPLVTSQVFILDFHDSDKAKWSKMLLDKIEKDQLIEFFGGTQNIEDIYFNTK